MTINPIVTNAAPKSVNVLISPSYPMMTSAKIANGIVSDKPTVATVGVVSNTLRAHK